MALVDKFAAQPGVTVFLALIVWLVSIFLLRCILDDLLEMHKSKTAVKKIRREYTFLRRLLLHPVREHTEHAVRFTHVMIYVHHLSAASMGLCLLLLLFLTERWQVYILAAGFCFLMCPSCSWISFWTNIPLKNVRTAGASENTTIHRIKPVCFK